MPQVILNNYYYFILFVFVFLYCLWTYSPNRSNVTHRNIAQCYYSRSNLFKVVHLLVIGRYQYHANKVSTDPNKPVFLQCAKKSSGCKARAVANLQLQTLRLTVSSPEHVCSPLGVDVRIKQLKVIELFFCDHPFIAVIHASRLSC